MAVNSPGVVQATNVTIKVTKGSVKLAPHPDSIGGSLPHRNHVQHLIETYNTFASDGRQNYSHAAIYAIVKKEFKAHWLHVPRDRFADLVAFLQHRIDRTRLGRINHGKGHKNYSTFDH